MLTPDDLAYPVLALSRDGSIVPFASAGELCRCNARALWVTRYHEGLTVFDRSGTRARVESVEPLRPMGALERAAARLVNRRFRVALRLEPVADGGLDAARSACLAWLERDPAFWEASADLEAWRSRLRDASSMIGLIRVFE